MSKEAQKARSQAEKDVENFKPEQQIKKKSKYEEPKLQTTAARVV